MAEGRNRGPDDEGPALQDTAGIPRAGGGHGAPLQNDKGDAAPAPVVGEDHGSERVRLSITARRVRIDPRKKRRSYIIRLERLMAECDGIVSDPEGFELQVKAMAILIRSIVVCYELVTDEQGRPLRRDSRHSREELPREFERIRLRIDSEDAVEVPDDPIEFCKDRLGYTPLSYMWLFLRDRSHFIANSQARQSGKTFNGMVKLLLYAKFPRSLIQVTTTKFRPSQEHRLQGPPKGPSEARSLYLN